MNYTFSTADDAMIVLKSPKHQIRLTAKNGHVHVKITGKTRKSCQTSILSDLSKFEAKIVAIYVYRMIDGAHSVSQKRPEINDLNYANYAEVFGSGWE